MFVDILITSKDHCGIWHMQTRWAWHSARAALHLVATRETREGHYRVWSFSPAAKCFKYVKCKCVICVRKKIYIILCSLNPDLSWEWASFWSQMLNEYGILLTDFIFWKILILQAKDWWPCCLVLLFTITHASWWRAQRPRAPCFMCSVMSRGWFCILKIKNKCE